MPSPYESESFTGRVAFAASHIAGRSEPTRTFDTCFETYDGAVVATTLRRPNSTGPSVARVAETFWNRDSPSHSARAVS